MPEIVINGKCFKAEAGTPLSELLINLGFSVDHPCGGRGVCQKCEVLVNGKRELSCRYIINGDAEITLPDSGSILSETGLEAVGKATDNVCLALDIGTTTLALAAVDTNTKKTVKVITADNPQRRFGADVMTRIDYCTKNSVIQLKDALIARINEMISDLGLGISPDMFVAGNTTMLHIFCGVDCASIGVAPYTPSFLESRKIAAEALDIKGVNDVITLPGIASFVGADIVAGLGLIGFPEEGKYRLLIDLGTNAEVVLFSKDKALCTAAAAGPCFEGANISCGMSATEGAVFAYKSGVCSTIGGVPPKGICGTGLIDITAELIRGGIIDETGYMESESYALAEGVSLEMGDVRQYQLAKSAVNSAILCLINRMGIEFSDIDKMYISGGFSVRLNIENAVFTGLLPAELKGVCQAISNSSLQGTVKAIREGRLFEEFITNAEYVDLSADPLFSELFINNMYFSEVRL